MLNVTSCPWGSLPQFSRIPLCWACHPHPQNSQQRYNPRVHQGYGWIWKLLGLQELQPTTHQNYRTFHSELESHLWISRSEAFSGWLLVWGRFEPGIMEMHVIFESPIWRITPHKSLKQANISHSTIPLSYRLQPTYLWSARKVSTVFKHYPSTVEHAQTDTVCRANTCAGLVF